MKDVDDSLRCKISLAIRLERIRQGLSSQEVARLCDLDPGNYSRIENAVVNYSIDKLSPILRVLNLSLELK